MNILEESEDEVGADRPGVPPRRGTSPVSLYKIDDSYFVHDGNHRISVVRFHRAEWIGAEVKEFRARLPIRTNRHALETVDRKPGHKRVTTRRPTVQLARASREFVQDTREPKENS